jgi:release factor glutamine methyltransferase
VQVSDAAAIAAVTIRQALLDASAALADAGCDTPRLDAELLLASVLRVGRSRLVLDREQELDAADAVRFADLVRRRADREPVAYILGLREFRRLSLRVDPRVLIPRPETELLVEVGLSLPRGACVVDVGTGSGAVALALADERPDLCVVGVDVSEGAIAVARSNAERLGLDVEFVVGDLLADVRDRPVRDRPVRDRPVRDRPVRDRPTGDTHFDAILANLPYVPEDATLPPEIIRYEPAEAVFGGADGLGVIRRLVGALDSHSLSLVALEVGFDQADAVAALLTDAGFGSVERLRDLAGHERVVVGRCARR